MDCFKEIKNICKVLSSITTDQESDSNYFRMDTNILNRNFAPKNEMKGDPMHPIMKGVEYNRTKNVAPSTRV